MTITSEPTAPPVPIPVSDCMKWCLQPTEGEIFDTVGSNATLFVDFPGTIGSIPANGTEFTLWGRLFTVNNATNYTSNSFKIVASGNTTGGNFRRMLRANFFFLQNTDIDSVADLSETLVTWNECGEQDNFTGVNMEYAALTGAGATVTPTNGVTPIFVSGAMVQTRLFKNDSVSGSAPITKFEGISPTASCDAANEICVDYMQDARRTLFTPMPDLSLTSEIDPVETTMIARFYIEYGTTYRDDNCQPQSGTFAETDAVLVMDTVFGVEENYAMRRYIYDHPDNSGGQPPLSPQFLTNKPSRLWLGEYSFAWLWLAGGYQSLLPTDIRLRFQIYYLNGTNDFEYVDYIPAEVYQVHCFNVSPGRLLTLFTLTDLSTVSHYFVRAEAWDGTVIDTVGWETYFGIEHSCENMVDVYFKTPPGGIGTILCEITDREMVQEGTEICLNIDCATTRLEKGKYGGRMYNQLRAYEKITLRARRNFSEDEVDYFKSLKASPERWIQVEETGYAPPVYDRQFMAKRLLIDTGGVKIMQVGEYIDLIIEGQLQDISLQTPRNA